MRGLLYRIWRRSRALLYSTNRVKPSSISLCNVHPRCSMKHQRYFLRCIVFAHISIKPSLASESGKALIASIALSAYSCAKALVCSSPSLRDTSARAYTLNQYWCDFRPTDWYIPSERLLPQRTSGLQEHQALNCSSRQTVKARWLDRVPDLPQQASQALRH